MSGPAWDTYHSAPYSQTLYERGPALGGNPLANAVFTSSSFDTFAMSVENVFDEAGVQGSVPSLADSAIFTNGLRPMGLWWLDLYLWHRNAQNLSMRFQVQAFPHFSFAGAGGIKIIQDIFVPSRFNAAGVVAITQEVPFFRSFRIPCRNFQFVWAYPNVNSDEFLMSVALRSGF